MQRVASVNTTKYTSHFFIIINFQSTVYAQGSDTFR